MKFRWESSQYFTVLTILSLAKSIAFLSHVSPLKIDESNVITRIALMLSEH